uniref:Uncharacterized protein n=1 Tax=Steinernema glaseri TaxID=37863 RepID=A0A1I7ZWS6_9BILA
MPKSTLLSQEAPLSKQRNRKNEAREHTSPTSKPIASRLTTRILGSPRSLKQLSAIVTRSRQPRVVLAGARECFMAFSPLGINFLNIPHRPEHLHQNPSNLGAVQSLSENNAYPRNLAPLEHSVEESVVTRNDNKLSAPQAVRTSLAPLLGWRSIPCCVSPATPPQIEYVVNVNNAAAGDWRAVRLWASGYSGQILRRLQRDADETLSRLESGVVYRGNSKGSQMRRDSKPDETGIETRL